MVDCFDRIAVHMTELALEPVRLLASRSMLGAVSLRTPSNGHRFLVTIAKRFADDDSVTFTWLVEETTASGDPLPDGLQQAMPNDTVITDPEVAYWAAVDGLCHLTAR